jgi:hypothetical protein
VYFCKNRQGLILHDLYVINICRVGIRNVDRAPRHDIDINFNYVLLYRYSSY